MIGEREGQRDRERDGEKRRERQTDREGEREGEIGRQTNIYTTGKLLVPFSSLQLDNYSKSVRGPREEQKQYAHSLPAGPDERVDSLN